MSVWSLWLILAAGGSLLAWQVLRPWLRERRRRRRFVTPLPDAWRVLLERRVPLYRVLPEALRGQLHGHIQVFLAEKTFVGCAGLEVDDAMRLSIAAQACLLLLNRRADYYPGLSAILVYPAAFVAEHEVRDDSGVHHRERRVLSGESWEEGKVIISWEDTRLGAEVLGDGYNVVLHEFAHQLDEAGGTANGAPPLASRADHRRWAEVMRAAYDRHCARVDRGEDTLLDPYAASDPAEFFAVATEAFFETPEDLRAEYPAVYAELARYYRVDPAEWYAAAGLA